jgi:hypothetical protein
MVDYKNLVKQRTNIYQELLRKLLDLKLDEANSGSREILREKDN